QAFETYFNTLRSIVLDSLQQKAEIGSDQVEHLLSQAFELYHHEELATVEITTREQLLLDAYRLFICDPVAQTTVSDVIQFCQARWTKAGKRKREIKSDTLKNKETSNDG